MRLLVTGFGPFPGVDDNPSGALARSLDGRTLGGVTIAGVWVPTSWRAAWPTIVAAVARCRPRALVMLGVASTRAAVAVERVAVNEAAARRDVDGALPEAATILADAPARLTTTLPWSTLVGDGVVASDDAGRYLCNYVFFRALAELEVPVRGFVHMPTDGAAQARALLERLARALVVEDV
ncbi:MAG: hypothetical protein R3A51_14075 [Nannocystaceae bacterium]